MLLRSLVSLTAQGIRSRQTQWTTGAVLQREAGLVAAEAAGVAPAAQKRTWVLATEGEATDTNIVLMHWDLSRADTGICPILGNHDASEHAGTWRNVHVEGAQLVGEDDFDVEDSVGAYWNGKVTRGYIKTCSVGWIPGELTLRGDLDPKHPMYREPITDDCGERVEGYVMGSPERPNLLVEASLTPVPADPDAQLQAGRMRTAERQIGALARGERVVGVDLAGAPLALRDRPGVRSAIRREVLSLFQDEPQLLRGLLAPASSADADRPFSSLFQD